MVVLSCARTLPALLRENQRESTASESGARGAGRKRPSGLKGWLARAADAACGRPCGHHPADIAPAQPVPLAPRHVPLPGAPMQREERGGGGLSPPLETALEVPPDFPESWVRPQRGEGSPPAQHCVLVFPAIGADPWGVH